MYISNGLPVVLPRICNSSFLRRHSVLVASIRDLLNKNDGSKEHQSRMSVVGVVLQQPQYFEASIAATCSERTCSGS